MNRLLISRPLFSRLGSNSLNSSLSSNGRRSLTEFAAHLLGPRDLALALAASLVDEILVGVADGPNRGGIAPGEQARGEQRGQTGSRRGESDYLTYHPDAGFEGAASRSAGRAVLAGRFGRRGRRLGRRRASVVAGLGERRDQLGRVFRDRDPRQRVFRGRIGAADPGGVGTTDSGLDGGGGAGGRGFGVESAPAIARAAAISPSTTTAATPGLDFAKATTPSRQFPAAGREHGVFRSAARSPVRARLDTRRG